MKELFKHGINDDIDKMMLSDGKWYFIDQAFYNESGDYWDLGAVILCDIRRINEIRNITVNSDEIKAIMWDKIEEESK